ncbi:MAG: 3-isopropylmalate dehydratase [Gammaproteobacteria bacterium]|nr:MAG: 3-isopropylmalate dehydratase [Gammaproteobacteria bacterium]
MNTISGRAWVFGDDVDTDVMAPGRYFKASLAEMAQHCLEAIEPRFAREVRAGDIVVGGQRFGVGSAREQAAMVLTHLGVGAVLAVSFGRIFYRNALNFGLPALVVPAAADFVTGDEVEVEPFTGRIRNRTRGLEYTVAAIPEHLMDMVAAGGLMPYLKRRLTMPPREPR